MSVYPYISQYIDTERCWWDIFEEFDNIWTDVNKNLEVIRHMVATSAKWKLNGE